MKKTQASPTPCWRGEILKPSYYNNNDKPPIQTREGQAFSQLCPWDNWDIPQKGLDRKGGLILCILTCISDVRTSPYLGLFSL